MPCKKLREKKITASPSRKKKVCQLVAEEKKNSTAGWPGKKIQPPVGQEKKLNRQLAGGKKLNTNSLPEPPPPDH